MSRRWATIFLVVVLLITAFSLIRVWQISRSEPETIEAMVSAEEASMLVEPEEEKLTPTSEVVLYFPSLSDDLSPEIRAVKDSDVIQRRAEAIMTALLSGPEGESLLAPFPEGVQLGGVYLGSLGVIYVDLRSDEPLPPAAGSRQERLMIGSLVESVLANLPELAGVALLWNGVQLDSFAGHFDTSIPFRAGEFPVASIP